MELKYTSLTFKLFFEDALTFKKFPTFIFRSVLGKELYKLSCVLRTRKCEDCPLNKMCVYSQIFTTPVTSGETFRGDKKPHPFTINAKIPVNEEVSSGKLQMLLVGESKTLFPYLFAALKEAGERGIFRERIKFKVGEVFANGEKITVDGDKLNLNFNSQMWKLSGNEGVQKEKRMKISFLSPVKIERKKRLIDELNYRELILNGLRRLKLLSHFYGSGSDEYIDLKKILDTEIFEEKNLSITSLRYYSFRQKRFISMRGFVGEIKLEKNMTESELSLLKGMEIFGVGKATSFGFGKIKVEFE